MNDVLDTLEHMASTMTMYYIYLSIAGQLNARAARQSPNNSLVLSALIQTFQNLPNWSSSRAGEHVSIGSPNLCTLPSGIASELASTIVVHVSPFVCDCHTHLRHIAGTCFLDAA